MTDKGSHRRMHKVVRAGWEVCVWGVCLLFRDLLSGYKPDSQPASCKPLIKQK